MKRTKITVYSFALALLALVSCSKNQHSISRLELVNPKVLSTEIGVVYENLSCELEDGTTGCECVITQTNEDCEVETSCTSSSLLQHYNTVLQQMFSPAEIIMRAQTHVRITEPELIEALQQDGWPLVEPE